MKKAVFLNASRLDYDNKLDFSPFTEITDFTRHAISSDEEILKRVDGQQIVITKEMPVRGDLIKQFPSSVELICEAGTGYNNIDINSARSKGIAVCNVPSYSTEAVAQLAITFMLNFSASLNVQQAMILKKDFTNFTACPQIPLFELQGKTLGIIGGGAIGGEVIRIAQVLGMKILVFSRSGKDWGDQDVKNVSMEELLQKSDFVSIHCPLTAETKGLINGERLKLMKSSAFLINTARGPIIDELALIAALKDGQIAGAALDVQDPEPPAADSPLFEMDNIIVTPHIGWKRLETRQRLVGLTAENIAAFIRTQPINVVN